MKTFIHQLQSWPAYTYDAHALVTRLEAAQTRRGLLFGKLSVLGFDDLQQAQLEAITAEIVKSSEIEGERLDLETVKGSVAKRLGISRSGQSEGDYYTDGLAAMSLDAGQKWAEPLTEDRLFNWHAAIFPSGRNVFGKLRVGQWRDDAQGPMQVVSLKRGKETVHFEAPPAKKLAKEMGLFLKWFESEKEPSKVLKAGIGHLWFETIHPFEDGNGRIGRNILDLALARADQLPYRCYSVSAQILKERNSYYDALEKAQNGTGDYTAWLDWYLGCYGRCLNQAIDEVGAAMSRTRFWQFHKAADLSARQRKVISRMLMGFEGRMTNEKYGKIGKCSVATATRDLNDLVEKRILIGDGKGGRSSGYIIVPIE
ncbi:MAG TPA: Fic family protein [Fimbriimonadaceae bacterium]|jgi:Fic family protein